MDGRSWQEDGLRVVLNLVYPTRGNSSDLLALVDQVAGFKFTKRERLKSKKIISALFSDGDHKVAFPLKIYYRRIASEAHQTQCAFAVPRKTFRKAVDRNRIKRILRDAYRLNKHILIHEDDSGSFQIIFLYIGREIMSFQEIQKALVKLLSQLGSTKQDTGHV